MGRDAPRILEARCPRRSTMCVSQKRGRERERDTERERAREREREREREGVRAG